MLKLQVHFSQLIVISKWHLTASPDSLIYWCDKPNALQVLRVFTDVISSKANTRSHTASGLYFREDTPHKETLQGEQIFTLTTFNDHRGLCLNMIRSFLTMRWDSTCQKLSNILKKEENRKVFFSLFWRFGKRVMTEII